MSYEWLKAFHVIAVIAWMAGLLYLPRLFVYHSESQPHSIQSETFKIMERRLLKAIMNPAMIITWIFGLWLAFEAGSFRSEWFHGKLLLVLVLSGFHGFLAGQVRRFATETNTHPPRFFRILNEVPTFLMVAIVILVIVKPF
jgi:protoporphyrinogen IX oxidase